MEYKRKPRRAARSPQRGKRPRPAELPPRELDNFETFQTLDPAAALSRNGPHVGLGHREQAEGEGKPRHYPVLYREVINWATETGLASAGGYFVDGTLGEAGHSQLILDTFPKSQLLGLDQDQTMLGRACRNLEPYLTSHRVALYRANFMAIPAILSAGNIRPQVVLLDVGVSRFHFDGSDRGFSINDNAPIDMRMAVHDEETMTAADIVNTWSEAQLALLFRQYGEERFSGRIARHIVENRPFERADALADTIKKAVPARFHGRIHPATRTFQALRIYVNAELDVLSRAVQGIPPLLAPGGVLLIISFHSLEDRIVKHAFREWASQDGYTLPVKKPIVPTEQEVAENKKSRSAKLRVLKKEKSGPSAHH